MSNFLRARASLRTRLILIPSVLLGFGIVIAIFVTLSNAKGRIDSEVASGVNLGGVLIEYALDNVGASSDPEASLKQLQLELSRVRHISVSYIAGPGDRRDAPPRRATHSDAPGLVLEFLPAGEAA